MQDQLAVTDPLTATPSPAAGPRLVSDCGSVADRLGDYAVGDLSELERIGVEQHLATCAPCRRDATGYADVIALAHTLPPLRPAPAAEARILAALRAAG